MNHFFAPEDMQAIWLTIKLASIATVVLLIISAPIAWWLSQSQSRFKTIVNTIISLPLVLPPTVLGFYLLVALGPEGPVGKAFRVMEWGYLPFTFEGLLVASVIYSLPFVVQPIQNAMEAMGARPMEVAATLGASPLDTFIHVVFPLARPGFLTAAILGFTHIIGEFGIVLMIGGNISGETRVISLQIYEHVEALNYPQAHKLAGLMVLFSFVVLFFIYQLNHNQQRKQAL